MQCSCNAIEQSPVFYRQPTKTNIWFQVSDLLLFTPHSSVYKGKKTASQHLTCPSGCCLFKIWHHRMICWEMRCLQRRLCAVREETECLGWTCSWSKADDRVRGLRDTDERRHRERTSHLILHHHPRSLQFFFSVAKRAKLSITCRPALQLNEGQNEKTVSYRV